MCGRFALFVDPKTLASLFGMDNFIEFNASYNIAPSQQVPVVVNYQGEKQSTLLTWGLVPSWAKDTKHAPINARVETVADKPFFRHAFKTNRCLVPVSGWYEWRLENNIKQPYYFYEEGQPQAIAGIWSHWTSGTESLTSFALLTREANPTCAVINDRMPVIIPATHFDEWLFSESISSTALSNLMALETAHTFKIHPVSRSVSSPKNNNASCIKPIITEHQHKGDNNHDN